MAKPKEYYIFDQLADCFYHLFLRQDWKLAKISIDNLEQYFNKSLNVCYNLSLANSKHSPSKSQIANMTDMIQSIPESGSPTQYQVMWMFDPEFRNNPGLNCMVGSMNNQTSTFFSNQQSSDYLYLLYSVLGIAAIAGVCCLGFLIHKKWSDNQLATSSNQYRFDAIPKSYQHHPNVGLNADGVNERRNSYHSL